MLILNRMPLVPGEDPLGSTFHIGDSIHITILHQDGRGPRGSVRVGIVAPDELAIVRDDTINPAAGSLRKNNTSPIWLRDPPLWQILDLQQRLAEVIRFFERTTDQMSSKQTVLRVLRDACNALEEDACL